MAGRGRYAGWSMGALLLVSAGLPVAPPPPRPRAPSLQVQAGWNGLARGGCWIPVQVTVTRLTEPIEGQIEVEIDAGAARRAPPEASSEGKVATATPVALAPGGVRQFALFLVPPPAGLSAALPLAVTARLRHGSRVVATGKSSLRLLGMGNRLVLTATGEAAGLQGWDGRDRADLGWAEPEPTEEPVFSEPVARVAHVAPEGLPERWNGYDAADLVVVTGGAWARMSRRQRRALRLWVESGGRAILCGERAIEWADPEARRLVPGALRNATVKGGSRLVARGSEAEQGDPWVRPPSREPRAASEATGSGPSALAAAPIRPREGAEPFLRSGEAVLGCVGPAGFGAVLWLGVDPFRAGMRPGAGPLWRDLVGRVTGAAGARPRLSRLSDNPTAERLANTLPRLPAPSRGLLGGIAVAYILIFGPLNIRVLRVLSRSVTAWLFLPALALGMTLVLLGIGHSWGQSRALLNRVSVAEAMSGATTAWERGLNGLFSPANAAYTIEAADPGVLLDLGGHRMGNASLTAAPPPYGAIPPVDPARPFLRQGALPTLQLEESSRWESVPLALWTLQTQEYERLVDLEGSVEIRLRRRPGERPSGIVRNGTPWRLGRAYLHHQGERLALGNLEPGAERAVAAAGWSRRRMADGPTVPGSAAGGAASALYDEAFVLLRPGNRGEEAVLVAETPGLMLPLRVSGVPMAPRAALLLIRTRVVPARS